MMKENKKGFKVWVKEHKKQLIIAGVGAMAVTGIILGYKNKDFIIEKLPQFKDTNNQSKVTVLETTTERTVVESITEKITVAESTVNTRSYTTPQKPFVHIRTLPNGQQHSVEKAMEAERLGIPLLSNQTLVDPHQRNVA